MFKIRETKIVSSPVEEPVLEVIEEPQLHQVVAMDFVTVRGNVKYIYYGTVTDYDGLEYEFEWDSQARRLCRLIGSRVTDLMWVQTTRLLEDKFQIVEESLEDRLLPLLEKNNQVVVSSLNNGIKEIDSKVEKLINTRPPVVSRVIDSQPEVVSLPQPRPVLQIQAPIEEETLISPEDDEIAQRALQFLQGSKEDNLDLDYLSL